MLVADNSRPKNLDQISHQKEAVSAFKGILESGDMPHLLLYGPPGTGKTSIILALARQLFGFAKKGNNSKAGIYEKTNFGTQCF